AAEFAGTNYRFCSGIEPGWPKDRGGMFAYPWPLRSKDDVDGLAHTAFASERLIGTGHDEQFSRQRNSVNLPPAVTDPPDHLAEACVDLAMQPLGPFYFEDSYPGTSWIRGARRYALYFHYLPPNSAIHDCYRQSDGLF